MSWRERRFMDLTGATVPIVQAPMAGAGGVDLAGAAIRGGAVGSLPAAMLTPEELGGQIEAVRAAASGPLNVNFFAHRQVPVPDTAGWEAALAPYYDERGIAPPSAMGAARRPFDEAMCGVVELLRPAIVSFHFGLPEDALLDRVKASGAVVLGNATTVEEARWLAVRGVDAIIGQGFEAGGHAGRFLPGSRPEAQMGTLALVPQIVDAVDVPVIAAGGIGDARGIAAALMLGASAVQIGTAYLHCPESLISVQHRRLLTEDAAEETVFTNLFSGALARGLQNRLVAELGPVSPIAPSFPYASAALSGLRKDAEARGDVGFSPLWAGQGARLGRALRAQALTEVLAAEALALIEGGR
ncbi:NAD(P)H-dependent flavin oxidoreductase [Sphingomonas sp. ID0503]|uniref:NAD(P)H-dependent flavin oxidoreductase n=1 Tax=Sphingomonas sp. ID0503 TaxID=3399691 RepID=UPI003AFAA968